MLDLQERWQGSHGYGKGLCVTDNGLVSGVDRVFKSKNSTFQNISDRLNPLGKSFDFSFLFLDPTVVIQFTRVHDKNKVQVQWKGPFRAILSFRLRTILSSHITKWPHAAYRNNHSEQEQGMGFGECHCWWTIESRRAHVAKFYGRLR